MAIRTLVRGGVGILEVTIKVLLDVHYSISVIRFSCHPVIFAER
jgi:hypothetical protein